MQVIPRHTVISYEDEDRKIQFGLCSEDSERTNIQVEIHRLLPSREFYSVDRNVMNIAKKSVLVQYPDSSILGKNYLANDQLNKVKVMIGKVMTEAATIKLHQKYPFLANQEQGIGKRKPDIRTTSRSSRLSSNPYIKNKFKRDLTEVEKKQKMIPKFVRNTTTNLRFDLDKLLKGTSDLRDNTPFGRVMSSKFNRIDSDQFIVHEVNKKPVFLIIKEFLLASGLILNRKPEFSIVEKDFGVIPSMGEVTQILQYLNSNEQAIAKQSQNQFTSLIFTITKMWTICSRFLLSLDSKKLLALNDSLKIEPNICTSISIKDIIFQHLKNCLDLLSKVDSKLDDIHKLQLLQLKTELCVLIIRHNLKEFPWFCEFEKIYNELLKTPHRNSGIDNVHMEILISLRLNEKLEVMVKQENYYAAFLVHKISEQLGVTASFWARLTDTITRHLKSSMMDKCRELALSQTDMLNLADCLTKTKFGISKAIKLCALKICISEFLVDDCINNRNHEQVNAILSDLLESENKLPLIVYFLQVLNQRSGNFRKFEGVGYSPIDKFIERFLILSANEKIAEYQIKVANYRQYTEYRNKLCYLVSWRNVEEFKALIQDSFPILAVENKKNKSHNYFQEIRDKKKYFMLSFINEIYICHILDPKPDIISHFKFILDQTKDWLVPYLTRNRVRFLESLIDNFPSMPQLALTPLSTEQDIRLNITIAQTMASFFKIKHEQHILGLREDVHNKLTTLGQLCAYPGPEEEDQIVLANLAYQSVTGVRQGDITTLNKCECGYMYFIGNCGRPAFERKCPSCDVMIGGLSHKFSNEKNEQITFPVFLTAYAQKEIPSSLIYQRRNLERMDDVQRLRYLQEPVAFKLTEFFMHVRYLAEYLVQEGDLGERLTKFLGVDDGMDGKDATIDYLIKVCSADYQFVETHFKSAATTYIWMNIVLQELRFKVFKINNSGYHFAGEEEKENITRNGVEYSLGVEIRQVLNNANNRIENLNQEIKSVEASALGCKRLVNGWISKLASFQDFTTAELETDLRIITGLRLENNASIADLEKFLTATHPSPEEFSLTKFVIHHHEVLYIFSRLFNAHKDLANYIQSKFEYQITWNQACRLSIGDFTSKKSSKIVDERDDALVRSLRGDDKLAELYKAVVSCWSQINNLRDNFPEVFDFRFLCHGATLPEEKIAELMDPSRARIAYFLIDDKHVESLFLPSVLQTFAKFQNNTLTTFKDLFNRVNGNPQRQFKTKVQQTTEADIIHLSQRLEEIIAQATSTDIRFNRDTDVVFDLKQIESTLANALFFGRCKIAAEEENFDPICYLYNFNQVYKAIVPIEARVGTTSLSTEQKDLIKKCSSTSPENLYMEFSKASRKLTLQRDSLLIGLPVDFDANSNLRELGLSVDQLSSALTCIEDSSYEQAVVELDPTFCQVLTQEQIAELGISVRCLEKKELERLVVGLRRFILTQLSGSSSEQLAKSNLVTSIQYSDVFETEDMIIQESTFSVIPSSVTLGQASTLASELNSLTKALF